MHRITRANSTSINLCVNLDLRSRGRRYPDGRSQRQPRLGVVAVWTSSSAPVPLSFSVADRAGTGGNSPARPRCCLLESLSVFRPAAFGWLRLGSASGKSCRVAFGKSAIVNGPGKPVDEVEAASGVAGLDSGINSSCRNACTDYRDGKDKGGLKSLRH